MDDDKILALLVNEPSWEDVILKIVVDEGMDPWDIDICRLADRFLEFIKKAEEFDLRLPARFVLVAAILLRMKSDAIAEKEERILIPESPENPEESELLRELASIPPVSPPVKRIPVRTISLDELVLALKKAFEVKERRERRRVRRIRVEEVVGEEEDITRRINDLTERIKKVLEELESERVGFSRLVSEWRREEIVSTFLPLLHLSQEGKVSLEQEELFEEIFVILREKI